MITKLKYFFWDVRTENYLVRLNVENGLITQVILPREEWLIINSESEKRRFLFEDRCQLLFFYRGNEETCTKVLKLNNNLLTWEEVVTIHHQEDWIRNKRELTPFLFLASTVFLGKFLLIKKKKTPATWCFDLVIMVSELLDDGLNFESTSK